MYPEYRDWSGRRAGSRGIAPHESGHRHDPDQAAAQRATEELGENPAVGDSRGNHAHGIKPVQLAGRVEQRAHKGDVIDSCLLRRRGTAWHCPALLVSLRKQDCEPVGIGHLRKVGDSTHLFGSHGRAVKGDHDRRRSQSG